MLTRLWIEQTHCPNPRAGGLTAAIIEMVNVLDIQGPNCSTKRLQINCIVPYLLYHFHYILEY
jgi:hypothetical protein